MKIRLTIVVFGFFLLISNRSFAQETTNHESNNHILFGISGGLTAPMGNFTKTDYNNAQSGFAGNGYNIGIFGSRLFGKHWSANVMVSYHQYSFKGTQNMASGFQDGFDVDSASFTTKGSNHSFNILVGPGYRFDISDRFSVNVRALIGLTKATIAGNDVWLEDSSNLFNFSQNESSATSLGVQGGIAAMYMFSKHLGVSLNFDYFYSKPDFHIDNVNRNNIAGREIDSYNQPIEGSNTNISIIYQL